MTGLTPPRRSRALALAALVPPVLALLAVRSPLPGSPAEPAPAELGWPMRGLSWEGPRQPVGAEALDPLRELGADWISQSPFGWSRALDDPQVQLARGRQWWGESDPGLVETARLARERGIGTLLKPHVWVRGGRFVGELRMRSEADWRAFFDSYEVFILHYARLAQREGMQALAVGTELDQAARRTADWRRLIARVRGVYGGPLTYCASWNAAEQVEFWDALDFVGVQAYYPLGSEERPTPEALRAAWEPIAQRLASLSHRTGRRVVFTEVGYKSLRGALRQPWTWGTDGPADFALQRDAFRAMFDGVWGRPWFGGTFVWKWHAPLGAPAAPPGRYERDFTPQGKPALEVIRDVYRRAAPGERSRPAARDPAEL